jgi:hypothetical protein
VNNSQIYEEAQKVAERVSLVAKAISSEYWVRTGREIDAKDLLPEIVAAVLIATNHPSVRGEDAN